MQTLRSPFNVCIILLFSMLAGLGSALFVEKAFLLGGVVLLIISIFNITECNIKDTVFILIILSLGVDFTLFSNSSSFITISFTDILIGILVLLIVFRSQKNIKSKFLKKYLVFLFLIILVSLFSLSQGKDIYTQVKDFIEVGIVLFYLYEKKNERKFLIKVINIFISLITVEAILGLFQHYTNSFRFFANPNALFKKGFLLDEDFSSISPAFGLFSHPNYFAFVLSVGIVLILTTFRDKKHLKIILLLLHFLVLYLTYSKGAFIWAPLSLLIFIGIRFKILNKYIYLFVTLSLPVFVYYYAASRYIEGNEIFSTIGTRWFFVKSGILTIKNNLEILLIGNGLVHIIENPIYFYPKVYSWGNTHNSIFDQILTFGLFPIIFLGYLFIHKLINVLRVYKKMSNTDSIAHAAGFLTLFFIVFCTFLFEPMFYGLNCKILITVLLVILYNLSNNVLGNQK
ncbi:hypothetical protein COJ36_02860 [Priestia megaterium]|uniref:hypothetical protein n=1 Tax=Priestia megaterium TaxID=1404 RepID=UPI000BF48C9A|nr:hypothetical protein [Priestia megaterium]PFL70510.1 hypothetical protein COJ36_02860 [Priestia megaterium]